MNTKIRSNIPLLALTTIAAGLALAQGGVAVADTAAAGKPAFTMADYHATRNSVLVCVLDDDLRAESPDFELNLSQNGAPDYALGMLPDADDKAAAPAAGGGDLAAQATNPIAALWQIQIQDVVIGESIGADGPSNQLLVQPVIPWKIGGMQQITRITVPLVWTPNFDGPIDSHTGLGDTAIINFSVFDVGEGGQLGVGPSLVVPTASSDFTGQGKWQAGPAVLYFNASSPKFQWGVMAYQNWSFASAGGDEDRPEVSMLFLQPILVWHFGNGWYLGYSDIPISINWNNDGEISVPVAFKLGAVGELGGQKVNCFIEPFYTLGGPDSGNEWGVKFGISLLFPTG